MEYAITMSNAISEYQKWKQQGEDLRVQAKQAMEARFRELLLEAAQLAEEYRSDFGGQLKVPAGITAFRYKASAKARTKLQAKPKSAPKAVAPKAASAPPREEPKVLK